MAEVTMVHSTTSGGVLSSMRTDTELDPEANGDVFELHINSV